MSLQPLPQESVQSTCQILLAFLSDEGVSIPGNLLEGVVSGKSLLRGIIQGQLQVCQIAAPQQAKPIVEPKGEYDPEGKAEPAE
jgi:hypothetical protein